VVLVNQFGWSGDAIGKRLPRGMTIADLRRAADVEFGMAIYEPFGISPLEPLAAGAICVITNVCGCKGFVDSVTRGKTTTNVLEADFTRLEHRPTIEQLKAMTQTERDKIEHDVAIDLAHELWRRLPKDDKHRAKLVASGQALARKMGWDQVISSGLVPLLHRMLKKPSGNGRKLKRHEGRVIQPRNPAAEKNAGDRPATQDKL
jgi:hypothetical protein